MKLVKIAYCKYNDQMKLVFHFKKGNYKPKFMKIKDNLLTIYNL